MITVKSDQLNFTADGDTIFSGQETVEFKFGENSVSCYIQDGELHIRQDSHKTTLKIEPIVSNKIKILGK